MHPLSYYTEAPIAIELMSRYGCYLQSATDQTLRELLSCYAAAMCAARQTDMDIANLCIALATYIQHRASSPISRSTVSGGELWASS